MSNSLLCVCHFAESCVMRKKPLRLASQDQSPEKENTEAFLSSSPHSFQFQSLLKAENWIEPLHTTMPNRQQGRVCFHKHSVEAKNTLTQLKEAYQKVQWLKKDAWLNPIMCMPVFVAKKKELLANNRTINWDKNTQMRFDAIFREDKREENVKTLHCHLTARHVLQF